MVTIASSPLITIAHFVYLFCIWIHKSECIRHLCLEIQHEWCHCSSMQLRCSSIRIATDFLRSSPSLLKAVCNSSMPIWILTKAFRSQACLGILCVRYLPLVSCSFFRLQNHFQPLAQMNLREFQFERCHIWPPLAQKKLATAEKKILWMESWQCQRVLALWSNSVALQTMRRS